MKILLILWAIGLAAGDKLDRTYLPPRDSILAGGYPEDLNLPLEFPKETPSSTLKLGSNRTSDHLLSSNYPNIALGIDRQGPFGTSSPKFTKRPQTFVSKNIYNIPTTTTSYDITEKTTFSPVEVFDTTVGPVTTVPQRYSSTSSPFDANQTYDQNLRQENKKANNAPQITPNYISRGSVSHLPNKNIGVLSGGNDIKSVNNQGDSSIPFGGDLDGISEVTIPSTQTSYFDEYLDQQSFNTFPTQRVPVNSGGININSQKFYDPIKTEFSPTDKTFVGKLVTNLVPSSKYGSTPTSPNNFDTRYNTNFQPQRLQAEDDRNAVILNYENILTPERFAYSFDTSNGIHADESGTANNGVKAKGSYSFTGDDGKIYTVEYTADENGFIARGDHLPTAPPIPDAILKNIEQAEKNRILGIVDDGSYDNAKYGHRKYQVLMDRIPQNQYNNIVSQPNFKESSIMTTFGNKVPAYKTNNGKILDKISSTSEPDGSSYSPDKSETFEAYKKDTNRHDKNFPSFYSTIRPDENRLFNSETLNFKNKPITERNKFRGNAPILDEELDLNTGDKYETLNPVDMTSVSPKEHNAQNEFNSGYVYTLPQNMLNDKDQNNLHLNLPSIRRNYEINPDDEKRDDEIFADELTVPNASFNFRKQKPVTSSPIFGKTFNNYVTTSDVTNPDKEIYSNRGSGQIKNGQNIVPERVYPSSLEPKFVPTTKRPYNYESPYTFNENGKQSTYPSSTRGSQYSVSTTPMPSDISSPITPSTSIFSYSTPSTSSVRYSGTTPSTSQITSTVSPSISSRRPTSNIPSRPSDYTGRISEPEEVADSRMSTSRPINFGQRTIGRPVYDGRPNKIPITKSGFSEDVEPGFVELIDPGSQDLGVSSRPGNYNAQSPTEKVIGEDFNGPKQPQRFDPEYGYYY